MAGWHYQLNGHEFEQTPGDSEGQGGLVFCSPLGHRVGYNLATEAKHQFMEDTVIRPTKDSEYNR